MVVDNAVRGETMIDLLLNGRSRRHGETGPDSGPDNGHGESEEPARTPDQANPPHSVNIAFPGSVAPTDHNA